MTKKKVSIIFTMAFIIGLSVILNMSKSLSNNYIIANASGGPAQCGDFAYWLNSDGTADLASYYGENRDITTLTIPNALDGLTITSIGALNYDCYSGVFHFAPKLNSITIPKSVKIIGDCAFITCTELSDVYFTGTEKEWNEIIVGENNDNLLNATIHYNYVPEVTVPKVEMKTGYTHTADAIRVNWNKVSGVTGYKIYRYDTVTKKTVLAGTVYGADTTTFRNNGLVSGRQYRFQVRAFIIQEGKMYMGEKSSVITAFVRPATVKIKADYTKTTDAIRINWNKAYGATGYIIYRWNGSEWSRLGKVKAGTTTWRDSNGLVAGSRYKYKVQSYRIVGDNVIYGLKSTTKTAATRPAKVKITSTARSSDAIRLNWAKVKCDGYQIFQLKNGEYKLIATIKNQNTLTYRAEGFKPNATYYFRVRAYRNDGTNAQVGSCGSVTVYPKNCLYNISYNTAYYNTSKVKLGYISGLCTGYKTSSYPGYVVINARNGNVLVKESCVTRRSNATVLQTVSIGQYGGNIAGYASCGPTAVAMLVNSEKKVKWNKDDLIIYSENHYLNDQGSLRGGGGMTAPRLLELISGFSGGKYTAKNIYGSNSTEILKKQIDSGHRALVVTRYSSSIDTYSYATHFVVVCGYEYINGNLYFYYADPYFGNGNRALRQVDAGTLKSSMSSVVSKEPACIIVLK